MHAGMTLERTIFLSGSSIHYPYLHKHSSVVLDIPAKSYSKSNTIGLMLYACRKDDVAARYFLQFFLGKLRA